MHNFTFKNPVKLIFGRGQMSELSKQISSGTKILMTYGGGSIFKNGVYDQVKKALEGYEVIEFGGIEANPDYSTLCKAINICKNDGIDYVLAVGGGSVIDGSKFIVAGAHYDGDPWDIIQNPKVIQSALPLGTVLTLPATASEMNCGAVISRRETNEKYPFSHPACYPVFSILDPETIYSLPTKQVANGIVDTYIHIVEQYLTTDIGNLVMDRWAEGLLLTLVEIGPKLMKDHSDYNTCANFMLTATMGLNGFISMGADEDWATHMIGHELTALHGIDHGETLAMVYPGTLRVMKEFKAAKLVKYAERVWGIMAGSDEEKMDQAIQLTETFFISLGMRIKLSDHAITSETIDTIVDRLVQRQWNLGEFQRVTPEKVRAILTSIQ